MVPVGRTLRGPRWFQSGTMAKQDELRRLRQVLVDFFNEDQIRALCMDLDISYDSLPGSSADAKARELVQEIAAQDRILVLLQAIYEIRPNAFWGEAKTQEADAQFRQALAARLGLDLSMHDAPDIPILQPGGFGRPATGTDVGNYQALLQLSLERIHTQLDVQGGTLGRIRAVSVSALILSIFSFVGIIVTMTVLVGRL